MCIYFGYCYSYRTHMPTPIYTYIHYNFNGLRPLYVCSWIKTFSEVLAMGLSPWSCDNSERPCLGGMHWSRTIPLSSSSPLQIPFPQL